MIIIKNRQKRRLFITIFILCSALYTQSVEAFWHNLKSPYPEIKIENVIANLDSSKCKKPPNIPQSLLFTSIYTDKGMGSSVIDTDAQEKYKNQTKDIWAYERQISNWIQNFRSGKNQAYSFTCSIFWLETWAEKKALLKIETSPQGEAVRKWHLAVISSHYIQIKKFMPKQKQQRIERWINKLATQVMKDYATNTARISRNNNHQYWAAWSVMVSGVALNNRKFYKYGIQNFKKAMKQVNNKGALPLELQRKSKAFHYHLFALSPLVMMAETAKINGYNLYKYRDSALVRLIDLTLNEVENGQARIMSLTGIKQDLTRSITNGQLAWLVPYSLQYDDVRAQKLIQELSPMKQRRIGGDLSQIYSGYAQTDN